MSNLTLQEIMVALTFTAMIITMINGARQMKAYARATDPAIIEIQKELIKMRTDVTYIRTSADTQATGTTTMSQRIDGIMERLVQLEAAVKMLQSMKGG